MDELYRYENSQKHDTPNKRLTKLEMPEDPLDEYISKLTENTKMTHKSGLLRGTSAKLDTLQLCPFMLPFVSLT